MNESLHPCASCNRHLRASTTECPFCGALRAPTPSIARPTSPVVRLSRAALFTLGTTGVAVGGAMVVACESTQDAYGGPPADRDAEADAPVPTPLYGGPAPTDGGAVDADGGAEVDAEADAQIPAPLYGGPAPIDAGRDAQVDSGGAAPAYGAPPPRDGG
jgi:hypothetical protein